MRHTPIIRVIAALLVLTFLFQDIVWANPECFQKGNSSSALQVPSRINSIVDPTDTHKFYLETAIVGAVKYFGGIDKINYHLHPPAINGVQLDLDFSPPDEKAGKATGKYEEGKNTVVPCRISFAPYSWDYEAVIFSDMSIKLRRPGEKEKPSAPPAAEVRAQAGTDAINKIEEISSYGPLLDPVAIKEIAIPFFTKMLDDPDEAVRAHAKYILGLLEVRLKRRASERSEGTPEREKPAAAEAAEPLPISARAAPPGSDRISEAVAHIKVDTRIPGYESVRLLIKDCISRLVDLDSKEGKKILSRLKRLKVVSKKDYLEHSLAVNFISGIIFGMICLNIPMILFVCMGQFTGAWSNIIAVLLLAIGSGSLSIIQLVRAYFNREDLRAKEYTINSFGITRSIIKPICLRANWEARDIPHELGHFIAKVVRLHDPLGCMGNAIEGLACGTNSKAVTGTLDTPDNAKRYLKEIIKIRAKMVYDEEGRFKEQYDLGYTIAASVRKLFPADDKAAFKFLILLFRKERETPAAPPSATVKALSRRDFLLGVAGAAALLSAKTAGAEAPINVAVSEGLKRKALMKIDDRTDGRAPQVTDAVLEALIALLDGNSDNNIRFETIEKEGVVIEFAGKDLVRVTINKIKLVQEEYPRFKRVETINLNSPTLDDDIAELQKNIYGKDLAAAKKEKEKTFDLVTKIYSYWLYGVAVIVTLCGLAFALKKILAGSGRGRDKDDGKKGPTKKGKSLRFGERPGVGKWEIKGAIILPVIIAIIGVVLAFVVAILLTPSPARGSPSVLSVVSEPGWLDLAWSYLNTPATYIIIAFAVIIAACIVITEVILPWWDFRQIRKENEKTIARKGPTISFTRQEEWWDAGVKTVPESERSRAGDIISSLGLNLEQLEWKTAGEGFKIATAPLTDSNRDSVMRMVDIKEEANLAGNIHVVCLKRLPVFLCLEIQGDPLAFFVDLSKRYSLDPAISERIQSNIDRIFEERNLVLQEDCTPLSDSDDKTPPSLILPDTYQAALDFFNFFGWYNPSRFWVGIFAGFYEFFDTFSRNFIARHKNTSARDANWRIGGLGFIFIVMSAAFSLALYHFTGGYTVFPGLEDTIWLILVTYFSNVLSHAGYNIFAFASNKPMLVKKSDDDELLHQELSQFSNNGLQEGLNAASLVVDDDSLDALNDPSDGSLVADTEPNRPPIDNDINYGDFSSLSHDNPATMEAVKHIRPEYAVILRLRDLGIDGKRFSAKEIAQIFGEPPDNTSRTEGFANNALIETAAEFAHAMREGDEAALKDIVAEKRAEIEALRSEKYDKKAHFLSREARIEAKDYEQVLALLQLSESEIKYRRFVWLHLLEKYFKAVGFEPYRYPELLLYDVNTLLERFNKISTPSAKKEELKKALQGCHISDKDINGPRRKPSKNSPWRPVAFDFVDKPQTKSNGKVPSNAEVRKFVRIIKTKGTWRPQWLLLGALANGRCEISDDIAADIRSCDHIEKRWVEFKRLFWLASASPVGSSQREDALTKLENRNKAIVYLPKGSKFMSLVYKKYSRQVRRDLFERGLFVVDITLENNGSVVRMQVYDARNPHLSIFSAYYDSELDELVELDRQFYRYIVEHKGPAPEAPLAETPTPSGHIYIFGESIYLSIGRSYAVDSTTGRRRVVWVRNEPKRNGRAELSVSFSPDYVPIGWYKESGTTKKGVSFEQVIAPAAVIEKRCYNLHWHYLERREPDERAVFVRYPVHAAGMATKRADISFNGNERYMFLGPDFPYEYAFAVNVPAESPPRLEVFGAQESSQASLSLLDSGMAEGAVRVGSFYDNGESKISVSQGLDEIRRRWLAWDLGDESTTPSPMMLELMQANTNMFGLFMRETVKGGAAGNFPVYIVPGYEKKKGKRPIVWVEFKKERVKGKSTKVMYAYLTDNKRRPYRLAYKGYFDRTPGKERFTRLNIGKEQLYGRDLFWMQWRAWHAMYGGLPERYMAETDTQGYLLSVIDRRGYVDLKELPGLAKGKYSAELLSRALRGLTLNANGNGSRNGRPAVIGLGDRFFRAVYMKATHDKGFSYKTHKRRRQVGYYNSEIIRKGDELLLAVEGDWVIAFVDAARDNRIHYMKVARNEKGKIVDSRVDAYPKGFFKGFTGTVEGISRRPRGARFSKRQIVVLAGKYRIACRSGDFISIAMRNGALARVDYSGDYINCPYEARSRGRFSLRKGIRPNCSVAEFAEPTRARMYDRLSAPGGVMRAYSANGRLLAAESDIDKSVVSKGTCLLDGVTATFYKNRRFAGYQIYCGRDFVTMVIKDGRIIRADRWLKFVPNPYKIEDGEIALRQDLKEKPSHSLTGLPNGMKIIYESMWQDGLSRVITVRNEKNRPVSVGIRADEETFATGWRLVDSISSPKPDHNGYRTFGNGYKIYLGPYHVTLAIKDGSIVRADYWDRPMRNVYRVRGSKVGLQKRLKARPLGTIRNLPPGIRRLNKTMCEKAVKPTLILPSTRRAVKRICDKLGWNVPSDFWVGIFASIWEIFKVFRPIKFLHDHDNKSARDIIWRDRGILFILAAMLVAGFVGCQLIFTGNFGSLALGIAATIGMVFAANFASHAAYNIVAYIFKLPMLVEGENAIEPGQKSFPSESQRAEWESAVLQALVDAKVPLNEQNRIRDLPTLLDIKSYFFEKNKALRSIYLAYSARHRMIVIPEGVPLYHFILNDLKLVEGAVWEEYLKRKTVSKAAPERPSTETDTTKPKLTPKDVDKGDVVPVRSKIGIDRLREKIRAAQEAEKKRLAGVAERRERATIDEVRALENVAAERTDAEAVNRLQAEVDARRLVEGDYGETRLLRGPAKGKQPEVIPGTSEPATQTISNRRIVEALKRRLHNVILGNTPAQKIIYIGDELAEAGVKKENILLVQLSCMRDMLNLEIRKKEEWVRGLNLPLTAHEIKELEGELRRFYRGFIEGLPEKDKKKKVVLKTLGEMSVRVTEFIRTLSKQGSAREGRGLPNTTGGETAPKPSPNPVASTPAQFMRNPADPEQLSKSMVEAVLSHILFSGKKLGLAFSKHLSGFDRARLASLKKHLEGWKKEMVRKHPELKEAIENFVIVDFDSKDDLKRKLADSGIDISNTNKGLVFTFSQQSIEGDMSDVGAAVHPVYIEPREGFSLDCYYPIVEIVTISLVKELIHYSLDDINKILGDFGIKKEELGKLNIDLITKDDAGHLVFIIVPNIRRYDVGELADRWARLLKFIQFA